jgi:hypothetical protein
MLAPRESESIGPMLLDDIRTMFDERSTDRLASTTICAELAAMEARPWGEWKASKGASAKPITPNQLARLLKPFGIVPDSVRIGKQTPKGYYRSQFSEAWERYLAPEGVSEPQHRNNADEMGTSDTFQSATDSAGVADQKYEKPLCPSDCCGVAVQKGGNGAFCNDTGVCAQCYGAPDGKETQYSPGVWLHPECARFYFAAIGDNPPRDSETVSEGVEGFADYRRYARERG